MNSGFNGIAGILGNGKEFDSVTELPGKLDIHGSNFRNPFDVDIVKIDFHSVSYRRQNGQFVGSVDTFNIECRIGFGKPVLLGLNKHIFETAAVFGAPGQDVVTGSVEDPCHGFYMISSQRLPQGLDDGHASPNTGFKGNIYTVFRSRFKDNIAVNGQQGFVCSDDRFAVMDGL